MDVVVVTVAGTVVVGVKVVFAVFWAWVMLYMWLSVRSLFKAQMGYLHLSKTLLICIKNN